MVEPGAAAAITRCDVGGVRIDADGAGWRIRAREVIDLSSPDQLGHFPHATIYPGVFVLESLRRLVSGALGLSFAVGSVRSARFLLPLVSGDVMLVDAAVAPVAGGMFDVVATATIEHVGVAAKLRVLLSGRQVIDAA